MKREHTPGPWTLKLGKYGAPHEILWAPDRSYGKVALVATRGFQELPEALSDAAREANATLIAAAPDLLAAAEMMLRLMEGEDLDTAFDGEAEVLRDAIARARGESA